MATFATRRREGIIGRFDFGSQTGRTDGIGDRHERFFAGEGAGLARGPLLSLMLLVLLFLLSCTQELFLVALCGHMARSAGGSARSINERNER
jgi:hypothetical protein